MIDYGLKLMTLALTLAFSGVSVLSQMPGNPDNWCRQGFFTRDSTDFAVGVAKGRKETKTYFHRDDIETCPDMASCRTKSYVVAGDKVITNRKRGGFVCAWFAPLKGAPTVGWLNSSELDFPILLLDAREQDWVGEWKYAENNIIFAATKQPGTLTVKGNAFWKGLGDNIHIGELDGAAKYTDGKLEYSDGIGGYDCRVSMQLVTESFLIVADNMNCGGANVTFSGVYRKAPVKPKKN